MNQLVLSIVEGQLIYFDFTLLWVVNYFILYGEAFAFSSW